MSNVKFEVGGISESNAILQAFFLEKLATVFFGGDFREIFAIVAIFFSLKIFISSINRSQMYGPKSSLKRT